MFAQAEGQAGIKDYPTDTSEAAFHKARHDTHRPWPVSTLQGFPGTVKTGKENSPRALGPGEEFCQHF